MGFLFRFWPYIAGISAILFAIWFIYDKGYDAGITYIEKQIEKETERQREANELAQIEAKVMEIKLRAQIDELEEKGRRHVNQAAKDPTADRACISGAGVQRLNRIE